MKKKQWVGKHITRERLLDMLIIIAACLVAWNAAQRVPALLDRSDIPQQPWITMGATLSLPGVNWAEASTHVVLAFTTACPYCVESGEFYGRLSTFIAANSHQRFIVVCPEPPATVERWMRDHGVTEFDLVNENFHLVGFGATPTLAIVDSSGTITDLAAGKLSGAEEAQVFDRLNGTSAAPLAINVPLATQNPLATEGKEQ